MSSHSFCRKETPQRFFECFKKLDSIPPGFQLTTESTDPYVFQSKFLRSSLSASQRVETINWSKGKAHLKLSGKKLSISLDGINYRDFDEDSL